MRKLHRVDRPHWIEDTAEHVHLLEDVVLDQELFLAGTGLGDVDGRKHALVGDLAVQHDFGVTGALEFFEDDFVHAAAVSISAV